MRNCRARFSHLFVSIYQRQQQQQSHPPQLNHNKCTVQTRIRLVDQAGDMEVRYCPGRWWSQDVVLVWWDPSNWCMRKLRQQRVKPAQIWSGWLSFSEIRNVAMIHEMSNYFIPSQKQELSWLTHISENAGLTRAQQIFSSRVKLPETVEQNKVIQENVINGGSTWFRSTKLTTRYKRNISCQILIQHIK